jgi:DNA helicase HerA-like ATPase
MSNRSDRRRALGTVVAVNTEQFVVELNGSADSFTLVGFDGQHYIARVGSYVLLPLQVAYVVAEVVGLRQREPNDRRHPDGQVDDAEHSSVAKYLDVVPVGMLPYREDQSFKFGVSNYPPLYTEVLYTQAGDLDRIFEVTSAEVPADGPATDEATRLRAFDIGTSVVFEGYTVKARVDDFFGGHAAVLGNTGSGKSCTVASILQSVFEKDTDHRAIGAAFVFLDTNGEYRQAFSRLPNHIKTRYLPVERGNGRDPKLSAASGEDLAEVFTLPHWFLNQDEWELLLRASERTQRPVLRSALGLTSLFAAKGPDLEKIKNHVLASAMLRIFTSSENDTTSQSRLLSLLLHFETDDLTYLEVQNRSALNYGKFVARDDLQAYFQPHINNTLNIPQYKNLPFDFALLEDALELAILYEEAHGNRQIRDYCSSLLTRFKSLRDHSEFTFMRLDPANLQLIERDVGVYVEHLLGYSRDRGQALLKKSQVTILDMNEVDDDVVQVISAVVARLVFERLRASQDRNGMPVNLVLEEAHRYIPEAGADYSLDATKVFERIAKEGRKYGLFITLASQRPSELSRTVLSQCSNFVVHRIQNPEDLQHVRRMTPFISESVMTRLPSLPKQHALIFGNAVNVPTTFRVRDASPTPHSADAKVSEKWFVGDASRPAL